MSRTAPFWLYSTGQKKHSIDLVWSAAPGAVKYVVCGSLIDESLQRRELIRQNAIILKRRGEVAEKKRRRSEEEAGRQVNEETNR